jgi:hypothetical protein
MAASGDDLKSNFQVKKLARRQPEKRQMLFSGVSRKSESRSGAGGKKKQGFDCAIGFSSGEMI